MGKFISDLLVFYPGWGQGPRTAFDGLLPWNGHMQGILGSQEGCTMTPDTRICFLVTPLRVRATKNRASCFIC